MARSKVLSAQGAASSVPSGNAIPTMDASGKVTMVQGAVIPPKAIVKSSVTPDPDTQWLRVAICKEAPFFAIMTICGTYVVEHGDGSPVMISFGGGGVENAYYVKDRITTLATGLARTVSKVRVVPTGRRQLYIDILFHQGGGTPTIGLIGAHNVELLTPLIASDPVDETSVYIYELPYPSSLSFYRLLFKAKKNSLRIVFGDYSNYRAGSIIF